MSSCQKYTANMALQYNTLLLPLMWMEPTHPSAYQHINSWNLFLVSLSYKKKILYIALIAVFKVIYKILLEDNEDLELQFHSLVVSACVLLILLAGCSSPIKKINLKVILEDKRV